MLDDNAREDDYLWDSNEGYDLDPDYMDDEDYANTIFIHIHETDEPGYFVAIVCKRIDATNEAEEIYRFPVEARCMEYAEAITAKKYPEAEFVNDVATCYPDFWTITRTNPGSI